jgi:hypothetical protein
MVEKKDFSQTGYIFGILSIVLAFFNPLIGLIVGTIGYNHSRRQKTPLSEKARKFNTIGIGISITVLIMSIAVALYLKFKGIDLNNLSSFSFPA